MKKIKWRKKLLDLRCLPGQIFFRFSKHKSLFTLQSFEYQSMELKSFDPGSPLVQNEFHARDLNLPRLKSVADRWAASYPVAMVIRL